MTRDVTSSNDQASEKEPEDHEDTFEDEGDADDECTVGLIDEDAKFKCGQTTTSDVKDKDHKGYPNGVLTSGECDGTIQKCKQDDDFVDSRWSFAVAFASFLAQALMGGYAYTGGIFYTILSAEFPDSSTVFVSWICSLPLTLWFVGSPIGSIITNRYGCRACSLVGGALGGLGLTLCYLATDIYMVFFFYGIVSGFGFGIQYVGFVTAVSRYFNKYRTVVTILTTIGPTFGMAAYSFFVPYLNSLFHWRGTLFLLGAISFNICACACVLFPISAGNSSRRFFHFQLFQNKHFLLFCLHCILCNLSNSMIVLHMPSLLLSYGYSSALSSLSLTVYATSNSVAKIILSIVGHIWTLDVVIMYVAFLFSDGTAAILTPLLTSSTWVLMLIAIVGFSYSVTGGHNLLVILDLVGQENFSDGVGMVQISKAAGTLLSGPFAGLLFQHTVRYSTTFPVAGSLMIGGCLMLVPVVWTKCRKPMRQVSSPDLNIVVEINEQKIKQR